MDNANRLLAVAAYITCGVIVGFCAYAGYHHYRETGEQQARELAEHTGEDQTPMSARVVSDDVIGPRISQIYAQREQIQRLQTLLIQKTELLERKTELLDKKTEEQLRLQKGLETAIDLLLMLSSRAPTGNGMPLDPTAIPFPTEDLNQLRQDWEKSRSAAGREQEQLDLLGQELLMTDATIAQLEQQTELEIAAMIAERQAFEAAIADSLGRIGVAAVPELIDSLGHGQPQVRAWAATALGRIGPDAQEAVPTLAELLSDSDPEVRAAAQRALDIIAPMNR